MIAQKTYSLSFSELKDPKILSKGTWIAILHASRIPPHVGLIINGSYNSLTIKEREFNVSVEALLKTISLKKIDTLFLKIAPHPVFSSDYQLQVYQDQLKQFTKVEAGGSTCLSPLKLFFEEFYAIKNNKEHLLFDFIETLNHNHFIVETLGLNIKTTEAKGEFVFNAYTADELKDRIKESLRI